MAPVTATSTGITRQFIDDPELKALLERLSSYDVGPVKPLPEGSRDANAEAAKVDIEALVGELERWPQWKFQEMVSFLLGCMCVFDGVRVFAWVQCFFFFGMSCFEFCVPLKCGTLTLATQNLSCFWDTPNNIYFTFPIIYLSIGRFVRVDQTS